MDAGRAPDDVYVPSELVDEGPPTAHDDGDDDDDELDHVLDAARQGAAKDKDKDKDKDREGADKGDGKEKIVSGVANAAKDLARKVVIVRISELSPGKLVDIVDRRGAAALLVLLNAADKLQVCVRCGCGCLLLVRC